MMSRATHQTYKKMLKDVGYECIYTIMDGENSCSEYVHKDGRTFIWTPKTTEKDINDELNKGIKF